MPEETKPVEREAFDEWVRDIESQRPDDHCAMHAAWDAALERAAQVAEMSIGARRREIADGIRALKGSR